MHPRMESSVVVEGERKNLGKHAAKVLVPQFLPTAKKDHLPTDVDVSGGPAVRRDECTQNLFGQVDPNLNQVWSPTSLPPFMLEPPIEGAAYGRVSDR